MTTENRNELGQHLPSDLRTVLDSRALLQMTLETVADLEASRSAAIPSGARLALPMMLTLICYSYSIGLYGSLDIENTLLRDGTLRYICARKFPRWQDIRRFRRANRSWIEQILSAVVTRVCLEHLFPTSPNLAAQLPMPGLLEQIRAEVNHRIDTAILMDGVEADA